MSTSKCPGADMRFISADDVRCSHCGALVEMFSDEQRRKCPECGGRVTREAIPACAAWCPAASACLGADRLDELMRSGLLDGIEKPLGAPDIE
ncbi:MAG: phosphohydrolase [Coriobacteriales bacterium]|nr:phosphohydrolase [Coriobacteriales bacterium]